MHLSANRRTRPAPRVILLFAAVGAMLCATPAGAQTPYKLPPKEVVDILDAPPTPIALVGPTREAMLLLDYEPYPPIALLARPFLGLGGVRVDSQLGGERRTLQYTGITIENLADGSTKRVKLPAGARIGLPSWSFDGKRIAFSRDLDDGIELWTADASTGEARPISSLRLDDVLGPAFAW